PRSLSREGFAPPLPGGRRRTDRDRGGSSLTRRTGGGARPIAIPRRAAVAVGRRGGAHNPAGARDLEAPDPLVSAAATDAAPREPRRGRAARRERGRWRRTTCPASRRPDARLRWHERLRAAALRAAARLARIEGALRHRGSAFTLLLSGRPVDRVLR